MKKPAASKNLFGLALVALSFGAAVWHVLLRERPDADPSRVTLRIGHWLMHTGMRESFDEAAREYEKLHPNVSIEQIAVPVRTWNAWVRTQLTGGTAPDITGQMGLDEAALSRHFLPLDKPLDLPNPYNAGSPLADTPWRDTFIDGLAAMRALNQNAGEIAGIYLQVSSLRLFYNKRLLRLVTGTDTPPSTYAELRALREKTDHYNATRGASLTPIAGCGPYAQYLFARLLPSQTQSLAIELSATQNLQLLTVDLAERVLDGRIGYQTPELRSSLSLLRDASSLMSPGFTQLQRDDALFSFLQQHSVAIVAGTWDYAVFLQDGEFETGVAYIPYPDRDDPTFGKHVLGLIAEGSGGPEAMLGVVRSSPHPEIATDFLRFLSSRGVATRFTELSKRVSSTVDVPPPGGAPELAPQLVGEVPGFIIDFQFFGANHTYTLFQRHLHSLISPTGGVDTFLAAIGEQLPTTLRRDMNTHVSRAKRDVQALDARLGIMLSLPEGTGDPDEIERLLEARTLRHTEQLRRRRHAQP